MEDAKANEKKKKKKDKKEKNKPDLEAYFVKSRNELLSFDEYA